MPAARYWRVVGIRTYGGGDLELSELHLYGGGGRVDGAATLTCSHAPTAGALGNLKDADTATSCRFAGADVRSSGFYLAWDMGVPVEVVGLRPASGTARSDYVSSLLLQYLDGGAWVFAAQLGRFVWPGPSTLYAAPAVGDTEFAKVSLLLHADGANGSTSIIDSSLSPKSATVYGAAAISTSVSKFGGSSLFGGNQPGARVAYAPSTDLDMGSGDFTVEAHVYRVAATGQFEFFMQHRTGTGYWGFWLGLPDGNVPEFSICNTNSEIFRATSGTPFPTGQWTHVAGVRLANVIRLYVAGQQVASQIVSGALFGPSDPLILFGLSDGDSRFQFNGYLDDVRITKGLARYTSNFVPPAAPFPEAQGGGGQYFEAVPVNGSMASKLVTAAAAEVGPHRVTRCADLSLARDVEFGGAGTIYGTTKTKGTPNAPTKARVVLAHQRSKLPVREAWSDPITGYFEFRGIDVNQQFLTLAEDADGTFRPVAANRLTPEVLP